MERAAPGRERLKMGRTTGMAGLFLDVRRRRVPLFPFCERLVLDHTREISLLEMVLTRAAALQVIYHVEGGLSRLAQLDTPHKTLKMACLACAQSLTDVASGRLNQNPDTS